MLVCICGHLPSFSSQPRVLIAWTPASGRPWFKTRLCLLLTVGTWWLTWPPEPPFLHLILEIPHWHVLGMKWEKLFHVLFLTVSGKFSADDSHLQCYPVYFLPCIIFKLFFSSHGSGSRGARYGKWDFLHIKKAWLVSWKIFVFVPSACPCLLLL